MGKSELEQVIKVIKKVKEPGEPPSQSTTSFELFECDLCKGDVEKSKLTQCPYCGRWICKENCWNKKNLACSSCSSVIELAQRKGKSNTLSSSEKSIKSGNDKKNVFKKIQHRLKILK